MVVEVRGWVGVDNKKMWKGGGDRWQIFQIFVSTKRGWSPAAVAAVLGG